MADTFYWHEMEQEIRERRMTWVFKGTVDEMKDSFMDHVDGMRRHKIYQHLESDCSTRCKEKGKIVTHFSNYHMTY